MPQGTIGVLDTPSNDKLETASNSGGMPALEVRETQDSLDGTPVQSGVAAAEVADTQTDVTVSPEGKIHTETFETGRTMATNWTADVTGHGVVIAESTGGDGPYDFPFNLVTAQTGERVTQVNVDLEAVIEEWSGGMLMDTWMVGKDEIEASSINYHGAARKSDARNANIGLGFELRWNNTVAKGIVYRSGYIAIWEPWTASMFVQFVADQLLPHAYDPDDDETEQTELTD